MGRLWEFLRNEQNRLVLGWLGGGLVVAATGAWAAFIYFYPLSKSPDSPRKPDATVEEKSPPGKIEANCGSVVVGRDVIGGTITTAGPTNADCAAKRK
jgi:hypothetical protein